MIMYENLTHEIETFKKYMEKNNPEYIRDMNEQQKRENEEMYIDFKKQFNKDMCFICGKSLKTKSKENPCLHWLVRMCNFKKNDFKILYPTVGFFQIYSYLRWVANQDKFMRNINDLPDTENASIVIETTIKYKHLEWSFSCKDSDFNGHSNTMSHFPHYHFQMRINGQQFINYSDYHIPFTEDDIFNLICIKKLGFLESYGSGGVGLKDGFRVMPENIIEHSKVCDNGEDATYNISTIACCENGISGEALYQLMEISNRTGQTLTKLMTELGAKCTSIVTPCESIPDKAKRSSRK